MDKEDSLGEDGDKCISGKELGIVDSLAFRQDLIDLKLLQRVLRLYVSGLPDH